MTCATLVLQTICGSASLARDSLPPYLETCIAILQLTLACIISVAGYLKLEARAEGHRSASLSYNEIYRHLSVVLARRPCERPPVFALIENTEQALLQWEKIAPLVPNNICARALKKESALKTFEMHDLPGELSVLSPIEIFPTDPQLELEIVTDSSDSADAAYRSKRPHSSPTPTPLNVLESPADFEAPSPPTTKKNEERFEEAVTEI